MVLVWWLLHLREHPLPPFGWAGGPALLVLIVAVFAEVNHGDRTAKELVASL